ncbi:unnamed protein product [Effrenium voratum]|nr:unnamed protein product [Effrenium voratum]
MLELAACHEDHECIATPTTATPATPTSYAGSSTWVDSVDACEVSEDEVVQVQPPIETRAVLDMLEEELQRLPAPRRARAVRKLNRARREPCNALQLLQEEDQYGLRCPLWLELSAWPWREKNGRPEAEGWSHAVAAAAGYHFTQYIPNTNINTTSLKLCQEHCQYVPGCAKFTYKAFYGECWFADANAVEAPTGSSYLIMGYKTCSQQDMQMPGRCRTETPGNGFPGQTAQASDLAWPGGKQPSNLECWPKEWDGAPAPCKEVSVLDDTKNGWPGKCSGLVEIPHVNGTECGENCRQQSTCQSWQNTVYYSCWQGLGKDCFVRSNFVPREAQRLQHGSVRVLKDLTGMQIVGLWKGFDNSEGFFENSADAVLFCKHMCYSDVRCQYWTYAPNFGCWLEDAAQERTFRA